MVRTPPKEFTTDGASGFISFFYEIINKKKLPWEDCAIKHDKAYWQGGDLDLRKLADVKLRTCVANYYLDNKKLLKGLIIPEIIYLGVRIGGQYWIPFPTLRKVNEKWRLENGARWGYGFNYPDYGV